MAKVGRPPKPVALRKKEGMRGHRPLNTAEPKYAGEAKPPSWLKGPALIEWNRLSPQLECNGLLTAADMIAFAQYCEEVASYQWLTESLTELKSSGLSDIGDQLAVAKLLQLRNSAFKNSQTALSRFGFSPVDRARIICTKADEKNPLLDMLDKPTK